MTAGGVVSTWWTLFVVGSLGLVCVVLVGALVVALFSRRK